MIIPAFRMPCLFQLMTGLSSGLRRNAGGKSAPCRTSGTEFSVSSAGPLYGGDGGCLCRLLGTLFPDRKEKFRMEPDDRYAYAAAGIVILNFIIKNGLLVFAGIDVIGRLPGV